MTPKELEKIGVELYGSTGWRQEIAAALHVHPNTITRWMKTGDIPPQWASHIKVIAAKRRARMREQEDKHAD